MLPAQSNPPSQSSNTIDQEAKGPSRPVKRKRYRAPRSLPVRILLGLLKITFVVYAAIVIAMVLMEERLVYPGAYFKDDDRPFTPSPDIQTVTYISPGEVTIRARLLEREDARDVVLFFHGNGIKAAWLDGWTKRLSDAFGANVLTAEYRGFGDDRKPTERGVLDDCFAARDFLCDRYGIEPTDIIIYGRSLGGGCASAVASRDGAKALVLEKTFDRMHAVAAERFPFLPVKWLMKNRYDSAAKLTIYDGPLLMVHGTTDTIVPMERGKALYEAAKTKQKYFIEIPDLGHNDPISEETMGRIVAWVREAT